MPGGGLGLGDQAAVGAELEEPFGSEPVGVPPQATHPLLDRAVDGRLEFRVQEGPAVRGVVVHRPAPPFNPVAAVKAARRRRTRTGPG